MNYLSRVALRHEYAKEVRLYGLAPHLQREALTRTRAYQNTLRAQRTRGLLALLPFEALSLLVTGVCSRSWSRRRRPGGSGRAAWRWSSRPWPPCGRN